MSAPPSTSDIHLFSERNRIINFDTEVSDCAFDPGVAKQQLNRPQVAGSAVDQRCFRAAQGMRSVHGRIQANAGYPLQHKACILPRREVAVAHLDAREQIPVFRWCPL